MFVPGTSGHLHGDAGELCSILNRAIREDDPNTIAYAVVFARAVNIRLLDRGQDPWLSKIFKKKQPYVEFFIQGNLVVPVQDIGSTDSISIPVTNVEMPQQCGGFELVQ